MARASAIAGYGADQVRYPARQDSDQALSGGELTDMSVKTAPDAAAFRRNPGSLRPFRRFLRVVPGPNSHVQLRVLRARRHDARRSADRQGRPQPGQAGPQAGHDAARHRLRLGRHDEAGAGEVRRQRHRFDAVQEPARLLRAAARHRGHHPLASGAAARLGAIHRPRRPHRVHRGVRALRVRALRRLLQERLQHPARRRADDDPEQHRLPPRQLPSAREEADVRAGPVHQVHHHRDLPWRPRSRPPR